MTGTKKERARQQITVGDALLAMRYLVEAEHVGEPICDECRATLDRIDRLQDDLRETALVDSLIEPAVAAAEKQGNLQGASKLTSAEAASNPRADSP